MMAPACSPANGKLRRCPLQQSHSQQSHLRKSFKLLSLALLSLPLAAPQFGCESQPSKNVQRVPVPRADRSDDARLERPEKPLPDQSRNDNLPQPFADQPLIVDMSPEARAFIDAYGRQGRPRIAIFVNRTLEGNLLPLTDPAPEVSIDHSRRTETGATVERRESHTDVYLHHGQYDEVQAKAIDYELLETLLTDWMAADNHVQIISPTMARKRLTDEQVKDLQSGRPIALSEVARNLDADYLIQVQARPTRQTRDGLEVRVIAEVLRLSTGLSVARGAVDVPPPLDKVRLNTYTRWLSRKLMDGMMQTWHSGLAIAPGGLPGPEPKPPMPEPPTPNPIPGPSPTPPTPQPPTPTPAPTPPTPPLPTQPTPNPVPTPKTIDQPN